MFEKGNKHIAASVATLQYSAPILTRIKILEAK